MHTFQLDVGDNFYQDRKMRYELILDTLIDDNLKLYIPEPCSNNVVTGYWVSNSQYHVLKGNTYSVCMLQPVIQ